LLQVLRAITDVFGQDMWFSTVLLLTHGGAPPPDTRHAAAAALACELAICFAAPLLACSGAWEHAACCATCSGASTLISVLLSHLPAHSSLPACSAGQPMGIDMFYQQRGQQAQNMMRQMAGDQR
jgi:hypothetical protein